MGDRKWGLGNGFQQVSELEPRTVRWVNAPDVGSELVTDSADITRISDRDRLHTLIPIGEAGRTMCLFRKDDDGACIPSTNGADREGRSIIRATECFMLP